MPHTVEFYFDCSSPWTYLGFERGLTKFAEHGIKIIWKPILVGGVFNTVNPSVYAAREAPVPPKAAYQQKDLQDWARYVGIEIGQPPVFPVNSVKVMRGAFFAIEQGRLEQYARSAFEHYWRDLVDISQDSAVAEIAGSAGLDVNEFMTAITTPRYKDLLRTTTDELIERGGFGSPSMFLDGDDMYFGNDRIELICARVGSGSA